MALYRVKGDFDFFRISSWGTFRGLPGRALRAPPCNAPCAGAGAASPDEDEEELEGLLESLSSSDAVAGTPVLTSLKGGRQCFGHNCKAWVPHPTSGTFKSRRTLADRALVVTQAGHQVLRAQARSFESIKEKLAILFPCSWRLGHFKLPSTPCDAESPWYIAKKSCLLFDLGFHVSADKQNLHPDSCADFNSAATSPRMESTTASTHSCSLVSPPSPFSRLASTGPHVGDRRDRQQTAQTHMLRPFCHQFHVNLGRVWISSFSTTRPRRRHTLWQAFRVLVPYMVDERRRGRSQDLAHALKHPPRVLTSGHHPSNDFIFRQRGVADSAYTIIAAAFSRIREMLAHPGCLLRLRHGPTRQLKKSGCGTA